MIYFVRDPVTTLVKIGYSMNVLTRVEGLRSKYWKGLFVEFLRDGDRKEEKRIHAIFSEKRKHGEWFEWDDKMEEFRQDGITPTKAIPESVNKNISMPRETFYKVETWAKEENRSISNAITALVNRALAEIKKGG